MALPRRYSPPRRPKSVADDLWDSSYDFSYPKRSFYDYIPDTRYPAPVLRGERPLRQHLDPSIRPNPQPRSRSPVTRKERIPQLPLLDAICKPGKSKDVTVHITLDVALDIEQELEEFSRLRRHGNFREAQKLFNDHLPERFDDTFCLLQYAHMLLEAGDLRGLTSLSQNQALRSLGKLPDVPSQSTGALSVNWNLLVLFTLPFTGDWAELALQATYDAWEFLSSPARQRYGSVEIQILSALHRVLKLLSMSTRRHEGLANRILLLDKKWGTLYQDLISEGRIWDFNDLFVSFAFTHELPRACFSFFQTRSTEYALDTIISDCETEDFDESTTLALLELVSYFIFALAQSNGASIPALQHCLKHGTRLAKSLIENSPESLRSRSFCRWLVGKSLVTGLQDQVRPYLHAVFLSKCPGIQIQQGEGTHIPIYIPLGGEQPAWDVPEGSPQQNEVIELALRTANHLQDYDTQALCLKHLILQTRDPRQLFQELCHLQSSVQEDWDGYLRTCLSRFMVCSDPESRVALAGELARVSMGHMQIGRGPSTPFANITLHWARAVILSAISSPQAVGLDEIPYYEQLPEYIRDFVNRRRSFYGLNYHYNPAPVYLNTGKRRLPSSYYSDAGSSSYRGDFPVYRSATPDWYTVPPTGRASTISEDTWGRSSRSSTDPRDRSLERNIQNKEIASRLRKRIGAGDSDEDEKSEEERQPRTYKIRGSRDADINKERRQVGFRIRPSGSDTEEPLRSRNRNKLEEAVARRVQTMPQNPKEEKVRKPAKHSREAPYYGVTSKEENEPEPSDYEASESSRALVIRRKSPARDGPAAEGAGGEVGSASDDDKQESESKQTAENALFKAGGQKDG